MLCNYNYYYFYYYYYDFVTPGFSKHGATHIYYQVFAHIPLTGKQQQLALLSPAALLHCKPRP